MNTERTSLFLMANLGAEVSRIVSAREVGDMLLVSRAVERAEAIIKKLASLPNMAERILELDILTNVIQDFSLKNQNLKIPAKTLRSYFMPFALRLASV